MRTKILFALAGMLLLILAGCGYQLQGRNDRLPGEVRTLYVQLMENRTLEPFLENAVTNAVVERFARNHHMEIVEDRNQADAILSGTITHYRNHSISYNRTDNIAEYRSEIVLEAGLRRAKDAVVLWKGSVKWAEEYSTSPNKVLQDDRENAAIELISERLADELYSRINDDF